VRRLCGDSPRRVPDGDLLGVAHLRAGEHQRLRLLQGE
jgi:hypothetical protein